ncbi:mechanosensitive ion channel protein MscS [Candidatus Falkowbacteria bacterium CG10_big_fil_rev_8_21_14_0_10_37_6]|uniref:Mechanosensitive ion channel protein MscS n=1 Tax=Candidatus Falkowbacteria bacterium CG10_big_fil_rev_8_21_14_0_10_37_6 TaxID=1974563 RepID=A0A2H0V7T8_9BACT|nr:MAG: mechanosensitive ion channel protein MscS [Candidatus Falkowbacteria bacterium CG10_big_fil_rev_8_21_14_0_10_37_6]
MYQEKLNLFLESYPYLAVEIFSNSFSRWLVSVAVFLSVYVVLKIFKTVVLSRLKNLAEKTKNEFDDIVINGLDAIHWPFNFFIAAYLAHKFLAVSQNVSATMYYVLIITVSYYIIRVLQAGVDIFIQGIVNKRPDKESKEMMRLISALIKIGLWLIAIMLILSNLGYNVSSLLAGFGIGGIVIAFAVQKMVSDLFSSLSIYFDKPFAPGDFIKIGEDMGTVKQVGMRTTRMQSLQGEELIVPNSEIVSAKIQNFGKMQRRRVAFSIGVTYNTPKKKLEAIPEMIKKIIKAQKKCTFDRAHFKTFGDFSLNFEIIYYVDSADYVEYMNIQQKINLAIVEVFEKEKIAIAFPTQTIHLEK